MAVKPTAPPAPENESACGEIERKIGKYTVKLRFAEQEVPRMLDTLLSMVMQAYAERQEQFFK